MEHSLLREMSDNTFQYTSSSLKQVAKPFNLTDLERGFAKVMPKSRMTGSILTLCNNLPPTLSCRNNRPIPKTLHCNAIKVSYIFQSDAPHKTLCKGCYPADLPHKRVGELWGKEQNTITPPLYPAKLPAAHFSSREPHTASVTHLCPPCAIEQLGLTHNPSLP